MSDPVRKAVTKATATASPARDVITLQRITQLAADLVGARYGALGVIGPDGMLSEFYAVGIDRATHEGIGDLPAGLGILGLLIHDATPLRLHDLSTHPQSAGFPPNHPPMHSFLGVPIRIRGGVFGNLYLTEKRGGADFTERDQDVVLALAAAAGVAIENARLLDEARRAAADRQRLAILEDRSRIAADLHDIVIQRLFATGLGLQALVATAEAADVPSGLTERLSGFIDDIDLTMQEIRRVIFSLQEAPERSDGLRADIRLVVTESRQILGFEPRLVLEGPIDTLVPEVVRSELLAVLREGLTNVAKHAHATGVEVTASVDDEGRSLVLAIDDDGVGFAPERMATLRPDGRGRGTLNMAARATRIGGSSRLEPGRSGGARLVWSVPLQPPLVSG